MFVHLNNVTLPELESVTTDEGRTYTTPNGDVYDSVTTALGYKTKHKILEWRHRVGEAKADLITKRASSRGSAMHNIIEEYLNNILDIKTHSSEVLAVFLFKFMSPYLDNISNIQVLEGCLYSDILKIAGRVDCIADFEGELAVVDFKSSILPKQRDWIDHYFMQECVYAMMYYERTGIVVKKLVTIIACEDGQVQVFQEYDILKYMKLVISHLNEYARYKSR